MRRYLAVRTSSSAACPVRRAARGPLSARAPLSAAAPVLLRRPSHPPRPAAEGTSGYSGPPSSYSAHATDLPWSLSLVSPPVENVDACAGHSSNFVANLSTFPPTCHTKTATPSEEAQVTRSFTLAAVPTLTSFLLHLLLLFIISFPPSIGPASPSKVPRSIPRSPYTLRLSRLQRLAEAAAKKTVPDFVTVFLSSFRISTSRVISVL
ncbi:hypothetical protein TgHK011_003780 [Trichoderma gracile]|nr:hypothetical protein TgHK011_003780 [Trichoderma gracile]